MPVRLNPRETAQIAARPRVEQWPRHAPISLPVAVALLMPDGPLTVRSLRTARACGQLATCMVAGKVLTTIAAVEAITAPALLDPTAPTRRRQRQPLPPIDPADDVPASPRTRSHAALMARVAPKSLRGPKA